MDVTGVYHVPPQMLLAFFLFTMILCGGARVAQSVEQLTSAQVMISQFVGSSPALGSVLMARSLEPASDSVSPCLPVPPLLVLCLCLSQK